MTILSHPDGTAHPELVEGSSGGVRILSFSSFIAPAASGHGRFFGISSLAGYVF
jgi:hypothetical protein